MLYLDADDVRAAMPPVGERLDLAQRAMVALVEDAEMPPKLGVHPRAVEAHTAAMPALLRGNGADGADDLLGVKWVTNFPTNRELGLPAIHATVLLTDAVTGEPRAILDGAPITAERTAAVSGVCLREWWPRTLPGAHVAILGAGVQAKSHVEVLAEVCRQVGAEPTLTIADRNLERAQGAGRRRAREQRFRRGGRCYRPGRGSYCRGRAADHDLVRLGTADPPDGDTCPCLPGRRRRLRHVHPGRVRAPLFDLRHGRHPPVPCDTEPARFWPAIPIPMPRSARRYPAAPWMCAVRSGVRQPSGRRSRRRRFRRRDRSPR